jgi:hypothetical protein
LVDRVGAGVFSLENPPHRKILPGKFPPHGKSPAPWKIPPCAKSSNHRESTKQIAQNVDQMS